MVGILGLTLVPVSAIPSVSITSSGKLLSVSNNVALAVSTPASSVPTPTSETPERDYVSKLPPTKNTAQSASWLSGYSHRKLIPITGSSGAGTDYKMSPLTVY